jgi:glycosyltransferase involved in cell wall biosynthesis
MGISVLHVLHSYRPGGMENMIAQMAWLLPRPEFSVAICALTVADDFKSRLPQDTPVMELHKKHGFDLSCAGRLRRLVREMRPDVVHSHNWNALIYSILALGGGATPLLHGEHALLYGWERSPWRLCLRKTMYARCDIVHTVSEGQVREMSVLGLCGRTDLRVIRNGVDTVKFNLLNKVGCRAKLGIKNEGLCIGMVARCVPEKRHALLLEAFEKIGAAFPGVNLVLAGAGGTCEQEARALAASHPFAGRVFWLGHRDDMATVYNALDLLILTSTSEGMSNVSLEAMSCGVPVLMHDRCGSEELIREGVNGSAAPMNNAAEVTAAVSRLMANPGLLQRMGNSARAIIESEHPLTRTAADYAAVYRRLATQQ